MIACERKFEEEAGEAEQRIRAVEAQWGKAFWYQVRACVVECA